jgi:uncharacterized protein (TIGR00251 family)
VKIEDLAARLSEYGLLNLNVKVIPKSSRNEIVGVLEDGSVKLKIAAAPEKGKANAAICTYLAEVFDVPKRNVQILRGERSPNKSVVISAAAPSPYR